MESVNLLFLCTHNRCRSILAEAITNARGEGRLRAFSAGSEPAGEVHPATLAQLQSRGYATGQLHSKSQDAFAGQDIDAVITLCDTAAGETCPLWLQATPRVHWGLEDPTRCPAGSGQDQAFARVIATLEARVAQALEEGVHSLRGAALGDALQTIARGH